MDGRLVSRSGLLTLIFPVSDDCNPDGGFGPDALQAPNRGNKLKRKDHPSAEGTANGQRPYKRVRT